MPPAVAASFGKSDLTPFVSAETQLHFGGNAITFRPKGMSISAEMPIFNPINPNTDLGLIVSESWQSVSLRQ